MIHLDITNVKVINGQNNLYYYYIIITYNGHIINEYCEACFKNIKNIQDAILVSTYHTTNNGKFQKNLIELFYTQNNLTYNYVVNDKDIFEQSDYGRKYTII